MKRGNVFQKPASQVRTESETSAQVDTNSRAGPSRGIGRTDSLKENVKPLSSMNPNRVPFQIISSQQSIPVVELPVLTPVNIQQIIMRDATSKTPGSSLKSRRKVPDSAATSSMPTCSKAKADGQEQRGSTSHSNPKGKGRA